MATPAYLGVPDDQKESMKDFLQTAAATDFWHDFHKASSKTVLDRLGKSYDIGSGLSVVQYQKQVLALRKNFVGTNLYDMFKEINTKILLVDKNTPEDKRAGNEDAILNKVLAAGGISYTDIRSQLIASGIANNSSLQSFTNEAPRNIGIAPNLREYTITAAAVKLRGEYRAIAPVFEAVSGGSTNFILMIDASFISMKRLLLLAEDPGKTYKFFIIESVENEGDPATKIGTFSSPGEGAPNNVKVFFLRDGNFKTLYKAFDEFGQTSNLFSGCSISAYRDESGLIDASIESATVNTTVKNIGTASEPKEAGFLAFQKLITMGLNTEEAMAHFLLKRAGDWCQALCLLDRGRSYTVVDAITGESNNSVTLDELITGLGQVEIGLLTHDKILKAYALFLGLNVFSSMKLVAAGGAEEEAAAGDEDNSSTSATWLVYYKNTFDANAEALENAKNLRVQSIGADIQMIFKELGADILEDTSLTDATISRKYSDIAKKCIEFITIVRDSYDLETYLISVRLVLESVSKIGDKPVETIADVIQSVSNEEVLFSDLSKYESIIHSYLQNVKYLKEFDTLLATLGTFAGDKNIAAFHPSFQDEANQIKLLVSDIKQNRPLSVNKVPLKNLEYFIYNTADSIKKDLATFIRRFDADNTIIPSLQYQSIEQFGFKRGSGLRFEEWYGIYEKEVLGNQAGGQRGGNTEFNIHVVIPLLANRVNTRGTIIDEPYDKLRFIKIINKELNRYYGKEEVPFKNYVRSLLWNEYILEEETKEFSEPYLSDYLEGLLNDFLGELVDIDIGNGNKMTDKILKSLNDENLKANTALMNEVFQQRKTEARQGSASTSIENLIDIGISVTNKKGLSYTALDGAIVDDEQEYLWGNFLEGVATIYTVNEEGDIESIDPTLIRSRSIIAHEQLYYRFLLYNLDKYLNKINRIELTINDEESGLYQEPYFTEDTEISVRKIYTCVSNIKNLLLENTNIYEAFIRIQRGKISLDEDAMPAEVYVSYDTIVNEIAIAKVLVIISYYNGIAQKMATAEAEVVTAAEVVEAAGGPRADAERERAMIKAEKAADPTSSLNEYQWVRLFYLICPSAESLESLKDILGDAFIQYIEIAKAFQVIISEGSISEAINEEHLGVLDHYATAFNDGLFARYLDLRGLVHGGKHKRNRYRSTRSKRKAKRRMTKGRKSFKKYRATTRKQVLRKKSV